MGLKGRFSLVLSCLLAAAIGGFAAYVHFQVRDALLSGAERTLDAHVEHDARHLGSTSEPTHAESEGTANEIYMRVWADGQLVEDSFPQPSRMPGPAERIERRLARNYGDGAYEVVAIYDLRLTLAHLRSLRNVLVLGTVTIWLLCLPLSLLASRMLLRPFTDLAYKAGGLNAGHLSFRFPEPRHRDEYGQLVASFNALMARLQGSFEQVSRFATNASHELRTPLSAIIGQAEMALRRIGPEDAARPQLEKILAQAERLRGVTNRLLVMADVERAGRAGDERDVPVAATVGEIVESLVYAYREGGKRVEIDPIPDRLVVRCNQELLQSIVSNLIENALKYARGRVRVGVRAAPTALELSVEDDGPGIPSARREQVFEPFYRDLTRSASKLPSYGLGLAIVKACVDARHGRIQLGESALGGLRIDVVLPLMA